MVAPPEVLDERYKVAHFYAFELLWLNGEDLRDCPLLDRKRALRRIMPTHRSRLLYVDHVVGRGEDLFRLVCAKDLEGVVAKWKRGRYMESERTSRGKIKNRSTVRTLGVRSLS
jgi:bifunctional non-homologous end joining protein LigD